MKKIKKMKKIKMTIWTAVFGLVLMSSAQALADGASIFASKCVICHGAAGVGTAMGPKLAGNDLINGDAEAIKNVLNNGVSGKDKKYPNFPMGMPKFVFSDAERDSIVSYLKGL
ncbi:MAG: cytochrome c [Thermodesulfobacteriota bacterium]